MPHLPHDFARDLREKNERRGVHSMFGSNTQTEKEEFTRITIHDADGLEIDIPVEKRNASQVQPQRLKYGFWLYRDEVFNFNPLNPPKQNQKKDIEEILPEEERIPIAEDNERPKNFDEFVGQEDMKQRIKQLIEATQIRNDSLPHMIFSGMPGLGKTSMAYILAKEIGTNIVVLTGNVLKDNGNTLYNILAEKLTKTRRGQGTILFIDEIHNVKRQASDNLLKLMEEFKFHYADSEGNAKEIDTPKFTLVGGTTLLGLLDRAFVSRARVFKFQPYDFKELQQIVLNLQSKLGMEIEKDSAYLIGTLSKECARHAVNLFKEARDMALVSGKDCITESLIQDLRKKLHLYHLGLNEEDLSVLKILNKNKQCSIDSLGSIIGESRKTYLEYVEPFLFSHGLLDKTPRGRAITQTGIDYLKKQGII